VNLVALKKSENKNIYLDKVKLFTKNVYLSVTDQSKPFWEHIGAKQLPSEEKYKLGGTKHKKRRKRKSKRKTGRT
jgi:hypothetical protein